jgi:hypothetical protein
LGVGAVGTPLIDPALLYCNTAWVPHPRDAFVFVARVGEHDANLLGRINNPFTDPVRFILPRDIRRNPPKRNKERLVLSLAVSFLVECS